MDNAVNGLLQVSQNIPTRSNLAVSMTNPTKVQVHVSAVGPRFSSLSWSLKGDPEKNDIDIEQRTPDENSKISCKPACRGQGQGVSKSKSLGPATRKSSKKKKSSRRNQRRQQKRRG